MINVLAQPVASHTSRQPRATNRLFEQTAAVQVLIIGDSQERLEAWRAALPKGQWEITGVAAPHRLSRFRHRKYDLAVVDVAVSLLAEVLQTLRATQQQIPVLVESSRLPNDASCAGLLPRYRAMPCPRSALLKLIKNRFAPAAPVAPARKLL